MQVDHHDLASELLMGMRLMGVHYRRIELAAPFGVGFLNAPSRAQFHFVSRGPVLLRTGSGALYPLNSGDAVLLPQGVDHVLLSSPDVPCKDIRAFSSTPVCGNVGCVNACAPEAPKEETTLIFSGCMEFDLGGMQMLVTAMPEVLRVDTLMHQYPEVHSMLEAMEREANCKRAGYAWDSGAAGGCGGGVYCARLGGVGLRRCGRLAPCVARSPPRQSAGGAAPRPR